MARPLTLRLQTDVRARLNAHVRMARVHPVRARTATPARTHLSAGLEAAGRLRDSGALGIVRGRLRHGRGDRVVAAGAGPARSPGCAVPRRTTSWFVAETDE